MSDTFTLDIPMNESPVPAALDALYDFIRDLSGVPANSQTDKVALFGSIVTIDIHKTARLYNDYLVRAFADRTIQVSPTPMQGAGDLTDRYSIRYSEMVRLIVAALDVSLSHQDQERIELHQATLTAVLREQIAWLDTIEAAWAVDMERNGIDPSRLDEEPEMRKRYYERRVFFLRQRRYAQTLRGYTDRLEDAEERIESIRLGAYPDEEARVLTTLRRNAAAYKVVRPKNPELEVAHGWDEITIQSPEYQDTPNIFDIGPLVESLAEASSIFAGSGSRAFEVNSTSVATNNHDRAWSASGGGKFMSFVSGSFSGSGENHFRSTISKIRKISVSFEHVTRLDIGRGGWYASDIFDFGRVQAFLKKSPTLRQKLTLLTTGLIVGRGLTLTLHFQDKSDVHEWGKTRRSGRGGVRIGGFGFGGGGGGSSSWETQRIDENNKTVTFVDSPETCRLLGAVVSKLATGADLSGVAAEVRPARFNPEMLAAHLAQLPDFANSSS